MIEYPNLGDADTGSDNDASDFQFLPVGIAINTGKRTVGTGLMANGNNPWNNDKFWEIKDGLDTLLMFHPRKGVGTPGLFFTDSNGYFSYDENKENYIDGIESFITQIKNNESN